MYSKYINILTRWLHASKVPVVIAPNTTLPAGTVGRCYNQVDDGFTLIEVDSHCARQALLTLAHEAGHWLGNETFGYKKHSYQRERQAKVYGWRVLGLVGAQHLFTRDEWMKFHQ
jgi:hypothetical protein